MYAAALRLDRGYHLDLFIVWPYVWLTLPGDIRDQITTARSALSRAFMLAAWAVLYFVLVVWWWPALALAAGIAIVARRRIRTTTDTYATLLETTTRLQAVTLASQLGIEHSGPLAPELGRRITRQLRNKSAP
jgi:hypothetical protein